MSKVFLRILLFDLMGGPAAWAARPQKAGEVGVLVAPRHCEEATRAEPGVVVAVGQVMTTTTSGRCLVASNHWVLLESPPEARHGPP